MVSDARIPMMGTTVDTATPIQQAGQSQNNNAMASEQLLQQHYQSLDAREKSRLSSTISGAVQLKSYLDNNDLDGAHNFLLQRKAQLQNRMGSGENVDTEETDAALEMLRTGKIDELKNGVHGLMAAGQVYGLLSNKDQPSNVQEWQYYNSLPKDQQERYLTMKRSNQVVNLGGTQVVPSQVNPSGAPQATMTVTPKPEDMPDFKKQQAVAVKQGENDVAAQTTIQGMQGNMGAFEALKTAGAAAPGGVIQNVGAQLANQSGYGGDAAAAQGDFSVKRAAAENAIRSTFRVVGSGSQSDADAKPFIDMLPNANDAADVKATKVDSAMQAMQQKASALAAQRNLPDPFNTANPTPATSGVATGQGQTPGAQAGQQIHVVNPTTGEQFFIDPSDLAAVQAEGFVQK